VPSSRRAPNARRKVFLNLSGQIEGQLRHAYDCQYQAGNATQASLAKKLDVDRASIHRRLMGHTNMTVETLADMVWALDCAIRVEIFDPTKMHGHNYFFAGSDKEQLVPPPKEQAAPPNSQTNGDLPEEIRNLLHGQMLVGA
jgi:hypothetical protein